MAVGQRLSKVAKELNVGVNTIVDFLHKKGFDIDVNPNTKVSEEMFELLKYEYRLDQNVKKASEELIDRKQKEKKETVSIENAREQHVEPEEVVEKEDFIARPRRVIDIKIVGKIDPPSEVKNIPTKGGDSNLANAPEQKVVNVPPPVKEEVIETPPVEQKPKEKEIEHIAVKVDKPLEGPKVIGKIDIEKPVKKSPEVIRAKPAATPEPKPAPEVIKSTAQPISKENTITSQNIKEETLAPEAVTTDDNGSNFVPTKVKKLAGPTVVGKISLPVEPTRSENSLEDKKARKKKRKRIKKEKERVRIVPSGDKPGTTSTIASKGIQVIKEGDKKAAAAAAKKKAPKVK